MKTPTDETYSFLSEVCLSINNACFDGKLPNVVLTLKGKGSVFGYYKHEAFVSHKGKIADEIAVNPAHFATHGFKELLQTLAHEMCHQWQYHYGRPSQRTYHNKQFAQKMKSIGLMPSSTGLPGGKETGQKMADYLCSDGLLPNLYNEMVNQGIYIPWYERLIYYYTEIQEPGVPDEVQGLLSVNEQKPKTTRSRYEHTCPEDEKSSVVYGKANLALVCGKCGGNWIES